MSEPVISIALDASAIWRATGRYLGYPIAISEVSLWDCLDQCKERLWDIEIGHDAAAGLLASWEERKALGQAAADCDGVADASNCGLSDDPDEISVLRTGLGPREPEAASDDLLRMARHAVLSERAASVSLLQARLRVEADVAADALAALEAEGTLGPAEAEGGRKVLRAWATTNGLLDEVPPTQHLRTQSSA